MSSVVTWAARRILIVWIRSARAAIAKPARIQIAAIRKKRATRIPRLYKAAVPEAPWGISLTDQMSFAHDCSRARGDHLLQIAPGMFARDNDAQAALSGNTRITGDGWQDAGSKK